MFEPLIPPSPLACLSSRGILLGKDGVFGIEDGFVVEDEDEAGRVVAVSMRSAVAEAAAAVVAIARGNPLLNSAITGLLANVMLRARVTSLLVGNRGVIGVETRFSFSWLVPSVGTSPVTVSGTKSSSISMSAVSALCRDGEQFLGDGFSFTKPRTREADLGGVKGPPNVS